MPPDTADADYDGDTSEPVPWDLDRDPRFYDDGDVTVVFAPGHRYSHVYYPRYTSPWWDTDGDGYSDGMEIAKGTDPLDPASKPSTIYT